MSSAYSLNDLLLMFRLDGERVMRISTGREVKPRKGKVYTSVYLGPSHRVEYHRLKFALVHGWLPPRVDHKDTDISNNLGSNLRAATHTQNLWNITKPRRALPRGVYKRGKRYATQVQVNNKSHSLGTYGSAEEASEVVEAFLKKEHGEFYVKRRGAA